MKLLLIFFVIVGVTFAIASCPRKEKIIPDPTPPEPKVQKVPASFSGPHRVIWTNI